jgi:hypothetical protein
MNRYRFRTREEFEQIGHWEDDDDCPKDWADDMNIYLGKEILSSDCIALCESNDEFRMDGWSFSKDDYVIMEEKEVINRNLLIECSSEEEADEVFDYLKLQGELINATFYSFAEKGSNIDWYFVGFQNKINKWTLARRNHSYFGDDVISAKKFLKKESDAIEKSLVGRWIKFSKQISSDQPKGSYDVIIEDNPKKSCIILEKYRSCDRKRFRDGEIELMPEGWSPNSEIPEYVECINALMFAKRGKIYPVVSDTMCMCEDGNTYSWKGSEFQPSTKEAYKAQFTTKFKVGDYVISDYSYLTLPRHRVSQVLEVSDVGRIKLKEGEFNPNDFRLAAPGEIHPKLTEKIEYPMYAFVGDPLPTTKPLIDNVQSISVNLRTKKKTNKFKF